ncbi:MAG: GGDEF domain-containing protein, partial [Desulfobulbaceae bacterium]|nr:GGDEF domain-containing protein [Desulfobulbaceae bacterium]
AGRLLKSVRTDDFVARFGGEEFVVIAPATANDTAAIQAERIRADVAARPFAVEGNKTQSLTLSIGVANLSDGAISSVDDLLRAADKALYAAKNAGRNRVCCATGQPAP